MDWSDVGFAPFAVGAVAADEILCLAEIDVVLVVVVVLCAHCHLFCSVLSALGLQLNEDRILHSAHLVGIVAADDNL